MSRLDTVVRKKESFDSFHTTVPYPINQPRNAIAMQCNQKKKTQKKPRSEQTREEKEQPTALRNK
jgi:hypothetical protein